MCVELESVGNGTPGGAGPEYVSEWASVPVAGAVLSVTKGAGVGLVVVSGAPE